MSRATLTLSDGTVLEALPATANLGEVRRAAAGGETLTEMREPGSHSGRIVSVNGRPVRPLTEFTETGANGGQIIPQHSAPNRSLTGLARVAQLAERSGGELSRLTEAEKAFVTQELEAVDAQYNAALDSLWGRRPRRHETVLGKDRFPTTLQEARPAALSEMERADADLDQAMARLWGTRPAGRR